MDPQTPIQAVIFDLGGVVVEADRHVVIRFVASSFKLTAKEAKAVLIRFKSHCAEGKGEKAFWESYALEKGQTLSEEWHA